MKLLAAARHLSRRTVGVRTFASLDQYEEYGKNVFAGAVADEYLSKHGASGSLLDDPTWVQSNPDAVASAVFDW